MFGFFPLLRPAQVKEMDMVAKIKREIQVLKLFHHPHIIKLYQVIKSPTGNVKTLHTPSNVTQRCTVDSNNI